MDRKIAYETQAAIEHDRLKDDVADADADEPVVPADFPPESFWLSKDAEYDWFDRNAFFERKDSTKGNNSNSTNLHPNSNNNSQRFSMNLKSKAAIIGLPKPQKTNYADTKHRRNCKVGNGRLFLKQSGSVGKSTDKSMIEPSSLKVSCMGRVRSKRDRKRRWRNRQRSSNNNYSSSMEKPLRRVVGGGDEAVEMRKRAEDLAEKAKRAVEKGGSSYAEVDALISELKLLKKK